MARWSLSQRRSRMRTPLPACAPSGTRRSRNAAGGWQAFFKLPGMLRHPSKLITFQYLSHRMARWMVTPELFILPLLANLVLLGQPLLPKHAGSPVALYLLAALGWCAGSAWAERALAAGALLHRAC